MALIRRSAEKSIRASTGTRASTYQTDRLCFPFKSSFLFAQLDAEHYAAVCRKPGGLASLLFGQQNRLERRSMKHPPLDFDAAAAGVFFKDDCSGCGLWTHALGQRHRLIGAVFELDGHEHDFMVAKICQIVHFELAGSVGLVAGFARLIGEFDDSAIMDILTGAAPANAGPEIIQHMAMKSDALAGGEPDDPDSGALGFRQQGVADTRIWILGLARELGDELGRPRRLVLSLGGFVEHGQSHENSSDAIRRHI